DGIRDFHVTGVQTCALPILKYLTVKGFHVTTAEDGSEACRRVFADEPDLVLLDVNMPELDGWSVLQEIRSATDVPVIMLTVLDRSEERRVGKACRWRIAATP